MEVPTYICDNCGNLAARVHYNVTLQEISHQDSSQSSFTNAEIIELLAKLREQFDDNNLVYYGGIPQKMDIQLCGKCMDAIEGALSNRREEIKNMNDDLNYLEEKGDDSE